MATGESLTSIIDFAADHRVMLQTVGEIVRLHGIETKRMQNGNAKGLDSKAIKRLRKILNLDAVQASA